VDHFISSFPYFPAGVGLPRKDGQFITDIVTDDTETSGQNQDRMKNYLLYEGFCTPPQLRGRVENMASAGCNFGAAGARFSQGREEAHIRIQRLAGMLTW